MTFANNSSLSSRSILCFFTVVMSSCAASSAEAHAAEQGLILLLPTDVYIAAGVSAFVLTVILVGLLPPAVTGILFKPVLVAKLPNCRTIALAASACSTALVFFLVFVGIFGPQDPKANLLSLTIWSGCWIGLVALQGLFGNLWSWINPWTGVAAVLDAVLNLSVRPKLPHAIGVWPAIALFLLFSLFSIADPAPADPTQLAYLVFGYWVFTTTGILIFGIQPWIRHFECFTIFFVLISKISPMQIGKDLRIGVPGWALLTGFRSSTSIAVFCLVILGAGSFDGLGETFWWLAAIDVNPLAFPGRSAIIPETIFGFVLVNLSLCLAFAACIFLGTKLANTSGESLVETPFRSAFKLQALAILPIGFGFHLAHFLPTFLVDSQYNLAALTDPFGTGADYLSLGKINIHVGFLSVSSIVRWIWLSQAGIIVLSHVFAVLIAHRTSRDLYPIRRRAVLFELPLTAFMVFYTVLGLWLLAAPRGA